VRKTLSLSVVVVLVVTASVPGETPAPKAPVSPYRTWIEQLGSPTFRQREEATKRLEAEGAKVLPALEEALGHSSAEVRRRARDLIPIIELHALMTPRRVTLKLENQPLRRIIDEIQRQTEYKMEFWVSDPKQTFSIDLKDVTYWEAIDRLCTTAHLTLQQNYGDERVILQQGEHFTDHVRYDGPFRFIPVGMQQTRYLAFNQPRRGADAPLATETLAFSFMVCSEPRLPLLGMGQVKIDAAYDTEKNSMIPPTNNGLDPTDFRVAMGMKGRWMTRYGGGNRTCQMQTDLNLVRPSVKATAIKVLRGSIPVTLLVEQKPVVLADDILKAKGKKVNVGTTMFAFEDASELPAGKQIQVKVSVTENNPDNPNDYTWMNTLYNRIELQDQDGTRYQNFGSSWGNSGPNNVQMTLTFGPAGAAKLKPPAKFVFQSWKTVQHQVPFEFRDIPLP
jgi:hypothetical protein